jgi:aspartyl-tRNA(Asn)/glutamyl-tRNA(Gln) amidotransferase subunit B
MPLMEIVTEPNIRTAEQARRYAEELRLLMRTIGASDAEMENGQMRVEANVSIRPRGREAFGTRVEVKNMNSMKAVERAIAFEIERQAVLIDGGGAVQMETRGWDEPSQSTYHMRLKEEENDYRYFPEPDLPPLLTTPEWLAEIKTRLPELPAAKKARFQREHDLPAYDANVIVNGGVSDAYERAVTQSGANLAKTVANLIEGKLMEEIRAGLIDPAEIGKLAFAVDQGAVSATTGKAILGELVGPGQTVAAIIEAHGFRQISDAGALGKAIDDVLAANPAAVADYRAGTTAVIGFLVGQVMKATRGQANAAMVQAALRERLDKAE